MKHRAITKIDYPDADVFKKEIPCESFKQAF